MPTTTPFNNLITFSRGSNATVTGSNGLIQWAPNNLLTFSEQFDNAAWTKGATTVAANTSIAPDGTTTADAVTMTTAAYCSVFATVTVVAGLAYTTSVYAKAGTISVFSMEFRGSSSAPDAVFDLANGTVTSGTGTITAVGNGWYRCSITKTSIDTSELVILGAGLVAPLGSILIWGAQLELGSTATTYNPTTVKNLLGFSEAFDNAAFTKLRASIVTSAQANPVNGLFNAQKLMEDTTASNTHLISQGPTLTAAPHVLSVYVKAAGRNWFALVNNSIANVSAYFDLANGVVGTVGSAATASITNVGSGWYRCSMAFTAIAATNNLHFRLASANGVDSYTGDGNSGVYIYGAQLSDSASLDPYVPTPGAAPSSTAFYGPRFDFDPVTRLPRGLLVEEQRTNLVTYSEDWSNAVWGKGGVTVSANSTASPDGTVNADALTEDTATSTHGVSQISGSTATGAFSFSVFVKANGRTGINLFLRDGGGGSIAEAFFNLSTGTATVSGMILQAGWSAAAATIQTFANGWYRCTITATADGTLTQAKTGFIRLNNGTGSNPSYTGNGTSGIFVWGAQLEAGAFATSYIPTVASTVTRSADVATITGQNFAQWFNQSEGTWAFDFGPFNFAGTIAGTAPYDTAIGAVTNGVRAGKQFSAQNFTGWSVQNKTGTPVGSATIAGSATLAPLNGPAAAQKLAIFQSPSASGGVVNGGTVTTTTLTATPTGTADLFYINPLMNGWFRNIRFIPARAADFQLQGLST